MDLDGHHLYPVVEGDPHRCEGRVTGPQWGHRTDPAQLECKRGQRGGVPLEGPARTCRPKSQDRLGPGPAGIVWVGRDCFARAFPYRVRRAGAEAGASWSLFLPTRGGSLLAPTSHPLRRGCICESQSTFSGKRIPGHPDPTPAIPGGPSVKGRNYPPSSSVTAIQATPLLCWEKGLGRGSWELSPPPCQGGCPCPQSPDGCTEARAVWRRRCREGPRPPALQWGWAGGL